MGSNVLESSSQLQSIKCSDCGKIFKSPAFASFHAEKSGHTSFEESTEEIKPLTEEEKKAKLEELRAKLAAKRAAQSKIDAEENKANEKIRRKAGQDLTEVKEEMKRKEQIKEAERKRKEKAEDAAFKAKIKAQIEADKRERAAKAAAEKAAREGVAPVAAVPAGPSAAALAASAGPQASTSSANEARLRVRAPGGMWTGTLPADATLGEVVEKIRAEGKDGGAHQLKVSERPSQFGRRRRELLADLLCPRLSHGCIHSSQQPSQGNSLTRATQARRCASSAWCPTLLLKPRRSKAAFPSSSVLVLLVHAGKAVARSLDPQRRCLQ